LDLLSLYYIPDRDKTSAAMRSSATFNAALSAART
jgi:monomeric isocitrate dehydrogenase